MSKRVNIMSPIESFMGVSRELRCQRFYSEVQARDLLVSNTERLMQTCVQSPEQHESIRVATSRRSLGLLTGKQEELPVHLVRRQESSLSFRQLLLQTPVLQNPGSGCRYSGS